MEQVSQDRRLMYALQLENGMHTRMIMVSVGRPLSFKGFVTNYIMQHLELTVVRTGEVIKVSEIVGIQKIPNENKALYEITADGKLLEPRD